MSHDCFALLIKQSLCFILYLKTVTVSLSTETQRKDSLYSKHSWLASHLINFLSSFSSQEGQKAQHCPANPAIHQSPRLHRWVIQSACSTLLYDVCPPRLYCASAVILALIAPITRELHFHSGSFGRRPRTLIRVKMISISATRQTSVSSRALAWSRG